MKFNARKTRALLKHDVWKGRTCFNLFVGNALTAFGKTLFSREESAPYFFFFVVIFYLLSFTNDQTVISSYETTEAYAESFSEEYLF